MYFNKINNTLNEPTMKLIKRYLVFLEEMKKIYYENENLQSLVSLNSP